MSDAMRILHAIRSDGFAGVEQFVLRLAVAQASAGHAVTVVGGAAERMRPALEPEGVAYAPATRTLEVARAVRALAREVDIVNTHMTAAELGTVIGLVGRRRHRPAIVATRHFAKPRGRIGPVPVGAIVRPRLAAQVAISQAVASAIDGSSTVVHPGVETREAVAANVRGRRVLIAQRLEPEKHTDVGIRAFAASGLAESGWTLEIAGDGSESGALRRLVATSGLDRSVRFLGFRPDVPELMDRAAMLVATCPFEHFGLTVLESMAGGLPVVAARAGGHVEMLDGLDPRAMFEPDDADDAAASLRSLADDPDGRERLGSAERDRQAVRFSLHSQLDATDAVYRGAS